MTKSLGKKSTPAARPATMKTSRAARIGVKGTDSRTTRFNPTHEVVSTHSVETCA